MSENIRTDIEIRAQLDVVEQALAAEMNPLTYARLLAMSHALRWVLVEAPVPVVVREEPAHD